MLEIKTQFIPIGHPNRKGININPIAVVIHYTANDSPTATDTANVNYIGRSYKNINGTIYESDGKTKFRYGSAQWFIDQDSATLCIPQNEVAWGCGDRNYNYNNGYKGQTKLAYEIFNNQQNYLTINYELCNNGDWQKTCDNSIDIIAKDMIDFGISTNMIFMHRDLTGKICAKPFVDNEKAWIEYKNEIINRVSELKEESDMPEVKQIKVNILGNETTLEGVYVADKNYVSIREILEKLGYTVGWNNEKQEVEVSFNIKQ